MNYCKDYYCKDCRKESGRDGVVKWRAKNVERSKEWRRKNYEKNKVMIGRARREYYKKNKEKLNQKSKEKYLSSIGKTMKEMNDKKDARLRLGKEVMKLKKTLRQSDIARKLGISRFIVWYIVKNNKK